MSTDLLVWALAAFLLAGTVKGIVSIGLPTTAIGILSQVADPRLAITLAILPIVVSNIWQVARTGDVSGALRRYAPLAATLATVLLATTLVAGNIPTETLVLLLGIVIVLFAATSLAIRPPRLPDAWDFPAQILTGILAGIFGGLTAIWAPPIIVYFLARRIEKDEFVRASGLLLLAGSFPLLAGYIYNGLMTGPIALNSAILVVPTLIGFTLGEIVRKRLAAERFRTAVLLVFLVMGLNLLLKALL